MNDKFRLSKINWLIITKKNERYNERYLLSKTQNEWNNKEVFVSKK